MKKRQVRVTHSQIKHTKGLFTYLWVVEGLSLNTVGKYIHALTGGHSKEDLAYACRHYRAMLRWIPPEEKTYDDFDLILIVLYGFGPIRTLKQVWEERYSDIVGYRSFLNDFRWWCRSKGLDPRYFRRATRGGKVHLAPAEFLTWWDSVVRPQLENRYVMLKEGVKA